MLITLVIIGIVAALTIPTLTKNIQESVLKNQFKKTYSLLKSTIMGIQTENGMPLKCFYWNEEGRPFNCTPTCEDSERNEYGTCTVYRCAETGNPLPSNVNGEMSECRLLDNELFLKRLKVAKYCENNALENGCIPSDYMGQDKVLLKNNPNRKIDPNCEFSDSKIKNKYPAFVLVDGTIIIKYNNLGNCPVYLIDINGSKGPNRWGYDLFSFKITGHLKNGITGLSTAYPVEASGKTFNQMLEFVGLK